MKHEAVFEKDTVNGIMNVTRSFNAPLPLVWKAWTTAEILDQWWAPKPYKAETKSLDFSEGGTWLYSMVGPEGDRHYCRADYKSIDTEKNFSYIDAFCDQDGVSTGFPNMTWNNVFTETDGTTTVHIHIDFPSVEDMKKITDMGFQEGFTAGMNNLDEYLANA